MDKQLQKYKAKRNNDRDFCLQSIVWNFILEKKSQKTKIINTLDKFEWRPIM